MSLKPDPEFVQLIVPLIKAWRPRRTLEVGCNVGRELTAIEPFTKCYGIDFNPEKIAEAKKNIPSGVFTVAGGDKIPFSDNFFDVVFSDGCLSHNSPETAVKIIAEMIRVGKKVVIAEYLGTRVSANYLSFSNCKKGVFVHNYSTLFIGGNSDFVKSEEVVIGVDKFAFLTFYKGLLNMPRRNALGLPTSTWFMIALFAGLIVTTLFFPQVWVELGKLFRVL